MRLLISWLVNSIAVFLSAYILPGVNIDTLATAFVVALVLGIVNTIIKPILFILTLPITIFTFGLFALILHVLMILLTDSLIQGFSIDGFWWAVVFGLLLTIISSILNRLVAD